MKPFKLESPSLRQELKNLMDIRQKTYLFDHSIQRCSYLIYSERLFKKFGLLRRKTSFKGKQENIFHYSVLKLIFTHENTASYKFYHQTTL